MSSRHHQLSHYFIWFTLKYHHLRCFSDYFCLKIFKINIFQNWIKTLSFSVISSFNIFRESVALALLNRLSMASVRELEWRLRELHNTRLTQSNKEKPRTQYFFLNFFWNSFYCLLCAISHVLSSPSAFTLFYMVHAQVSPSEMFFRFVLFKNFQHRHFPKLDENYFIFGEIIFWYFPWVSGPHHPRIA